MPKNYYLRIIISWFTAKKGIKTFKINSWRHLITLPCKLVPRVARERAYIEAKNLNNFYTNDLLTQSTVIISIKQTTNKAPWYSSLSYQA